MFLAYFYIILYILCLYGLTIIGIINFAIGIDEMINNDQDRNCCKYSKDYKNSKE